MKFVTASTVCIATAFASSCGHVSGTRPCKVDPIPANVSLGQSALPAPPGAVVDTEETLEPDPRIRTWDRIYVVRRRLVRMSAEGHVPADLSEVLFADDFIDYVRDGWGRELAYRHDGPHFEVRSAGLDGCFYTDDDISATDKEMPPRP